MSNYVEKSNIISALQRFHENDLNLFATKDEVQASVNAEASARETADRILDARVTNLEQTTKQQEVTVSYPDDGVYASIMPDGIPALAAKYAEVPTIKGKTRAWNQLVDTNTTEVTLVSGRVYFTVISGVFSVVTGTGASVSVTGGTDIVRDLTLIMPEFTPTGVNATDVATVLKALPDLAKIDAYNAGSLVDTTVTGVKTTSDNILNPATATHQRSKYVSVVNGYIVSWGSGWAAMTSYQPIKPNTSYELLFPNAFGGSNTAGIAFYDKDKVFISGIDYNNAFKSRIFTTPSTAAYMRFSYNSAWEIANISLHLSGYNNGIFYPYTDPLDTLMLSAPVALKSARKVAEKLDIRTGKKTRPVGIVDLGTLEWLKSGSSEYFYAKISDAKTGGGVQCSRYVYDGASTGSSRTDKSINLNIYYGNNTVSVKDSSFLNSSANEFATAMSGVMLNYELATPLPDEQVCDPIPDNFLEVQGGGTVRTIQSQSPVIDNCLDVTYDLIPSA